MAGNTRAYLIAGTQHGGRPGVDPQPGPCANPRNWHSATPALRALFVALEEWVTAGTEPPPSRVPTAADGTATTPPAIAMPRVKGFAHAPGMNPVLAPVDWIDPPEHDGASLPAHVSAVDRDGNEVAGIRLPSIAVPLGTHTGWNVYRDQPDELADRDGSFIAFARTKADREALDDPRPSLEERYGSREAYAAKVEAAAQALVGERLLLPDDAARIRRSGESVRQILNGDKPGEEIMRFTRLTGCASALALLIGFGSAAAQAQLMIIGNDQKPGLDADRKATMGGPGKDTVSIVDMSSPAALKIVATIPVDNTVIGPPTNLAISPSRDIALVANSMNVQEKEGKFAPVPDDRMFVIDLKANPPAILDTLHAGKQPSGMAIAPNGKLALVCNRADGTVTVLSIDGKTVKVAGSVTVGEAKDSVSSVAIAPDGKRALVAKAAANAIAELTIDGGKVTYRQGRSACRQLPIQRRDQPGRQDRPHRQ